MLLMCLKSFMQIESEEIPWIEKVLSQAAEMEPVVSVLGKLNYKWCSVTAIHQIIPSGAEKCV